MSSGHFINGNFRPQAYYNKFLIALMKISVIIPAYNEERRLGLFLESAKHYLELHFPHSHEIVVVDDGSSDGTSAVVTKALRFSPLIRLPTNMGKGAAVRAGMLAAKGDLLLFSDADGSTPISEESRLRQFIQQGADIAIGSRAKVGGKRQWQLFGNQKLPQRKNGVSWNVKPHRHVLGRIFSALVKYHLKLPYEDTQCGFKMFTKAAAQNLFSQSVVNGFCFDVEILYLATLFQYKVTEVAVNWADVSDSKINLAGDSLSMLRDLFQIKKMHRKDSFSQASIQKRRQMNFTF